MRRRSQLLAGLLAVAHLAFSNANVSNAQEADARLERIAAQRADLAAARTEALELLERMSVFLGKQKSFRVRAVSTYEAVQPLGLRLEFGSESELVLRRPDRLWVQRRDREGETRTFHYDGEMVSLMFESENAYVQVERTGSVEEMLDYVVDDLEMPMPLSDLLDQNFYVGIADRIELGVIIGDSRIAGRQCTQAAYRTEDVDFQLWVAAGDKPIPCRVVIAHTDRRGAPQFRAQFLDWELGVEASDERFAFRPPDDAERLLVRTSDVKGGQ